MLDLAAPIHAPPGFVRQPPPNPALLRALTIGLEAWFDPVFVGLEGRDLARPALWVGNHGRYGVFDSPLMIAHLETRYGVFLRALADNMHLRLPGVRQLVLWGGAVPGNQQDAGQLMQAGQHVLVYPGGAREVSRRRHENYRLVWKRRTGFARLAMAHGYDIIPFGQVGADEIYRPVLDADDIRATRAWRWLAGPTGIKALTRDGDFLPAVPAGIGDTPIPKPQRLYFGFGERIPTSDLRGLEHDEAAVWRLRERVASAVESEVARMLDVRRADRPHWPAWRRWLTA